MRLLLFATLGSNQAVSERANVSRGRRHTYGPELRTDTASCSGFTVAAKGQGEESGGEGMRGEKMWDREMQRKGERKREKGNVKVGMGIEKGRNKGWDERVGGRWQEGSMQIAQDLTGIFLDS